MLISIDGYIFQDGFFNHHPDVVVFCSVILEVMIFSKKEYHYKMLPMEFLC